MLEAKGNEGDEALSLLSIDNEQFVLTLCIRQGCQLATLAILQVRLFLSFDFGFSRYLSVRVRGHDSLLVSVEESSALGNARW